MKSYCIGCAVDMVYIGSFPMILDEGTKIIELYVCLNRRCNRYGLLTIVKKG